MLVEASRLTKKYGQTMAVDHLDLTVNPGEVFGFLGPNGAGKTTTIKMLAGLLAPASGTAKICGVNVAEDPVKAKALLGYVPDTPDVYEKLTAREILEFVADLRRMDRRKSASRIQELLALFELVDRQDDLLGGYSHGMKQKVCIACGLLGEPKVLFLDEPTVGLDPRSARLIKDVLRKGADASLEDLFLKLTGGEEYKELIRHLSGGER